MALLRANQIESSAISKGSTPFTVHYLQRGIHLSEKLMSLEQIRMLFQECDVALINKLRIEFGNHEYVCASSLAFWNFH